MLARSRVEATFWIFEFGGGPVFLKDLKFCFVEDGVYHENMETNVSEKIKMERKEGTSVNVGTLERLAERLARTIGSVPSLIAHSIFFVGIFSLSFFGFTFDQILLILTTLVSLEAIYLAIFIQMTVNRHSENIEEVREDIEDIQEDVEDISEDIEDIQENVEEISGDAEDPTDRKLEKIESALQALVRDIEEIRKKE